VNLEALSAHLEIRQALANYCRGVDRKDVALLKSVYHDDATDDVYFGPDGSCRDKELTARMHAPPATYSNY